MTLYSVDNIIIILSKYAFLRGVIMTGRGMDLRKGPILLSIIKFTIPIMISGILQSLFNAADIAIVGMFCGSNSVGAVGGTTSLVHLIVNLFIGLSVGAGVSSAFYIGANDKENIHKTVHTAIPLAVICGAFLTFIGVFFAKNFLQLLDTPKEIINLSEVYMKIFFSGSIFSLVYNFGAAILRSAGDTKGPLIYLSVSGALNVVLNIIFVTAFDMNVAGVALATVISQGLSAVLVMSALVKRNDDCKFYFSKMHIYPKLLKKIVSIGLPAGIQSCMFSLSNVIIQSSVNSFGAAATAGSAASSTVENFSYIIVNSFHQTALNFTGQNMGARQHKRVIKILRTGILSAFIVGTVCGLFSFVFARQLLGIFINDSQQAMEMAIMRITTITLFYGFCGAMEVISGTIRGVGSSVTPMIIAIFGICGLRVFWVFTIFAIPQFHSLKSLFVSYPLSWALTSIAQVIAFTFIWKRKVKNRFKE